MHATAIAREGVAADSKPAPDSEQSSVRRRQSATTLKSAVVGSAGVTAALRGQSTRGAAIATKVATARSLQSLVPEDSREAQLLAIAILRRDEALLDELIRRVSRR